MLPVHDLRSETGQIDFGRVLKRLGDTSSPRGDTAATVEKIMGHVQTRRDAGLVNMMREYTDPSFGASRVRVTDDELAAAEASLDPDLRKSIERAIANVTAYQQHVMPTDPGTVKVDGAELGMRWDAIEKVGLYVPGGTAVLFSTLVMLAVPAIVAGVKPANIGVSCPPPTRTGDDAKDSASRTSPGELNPVVLATARILGIERVYRIGGAQAIAAMAYGTDRVEKVDLIAGPGNVYVQLAKGRLGGVCGTDGGFYGPSEIVTIADDSANPAWIAADLIAQAEHDPGKCFLVSWQPEVIEEVLVQISEQLKDRTRSEAITKALKGDSCAVLAPDRDAAVGGRQPGRLRARQPVGQRPRRHARRHPLRRRGVPGPPDPRRRRRLPRRPVALFADRHHRPLLQRGERLHLPEAHRNGRVSQEGHEKANHRRHRPHGRSRRPRRPRGVGNGAGLDAKT